MMALAAKAPARVIGAGALIDERLGFEVDLVTRGSLPADAMHRSERHHVLMVQRGHWRLDWDGGAATLAPGDTCAVQPGIAHGLAPSMTGEAALFRVTDTEDQAGPTRRA